MVGSIGFGKFKNRFRHFIWIWNLFKHESFTFSSGLDFHLSEIEHGFRESIDYRCHILNAIETKLRNSSSKQAILLDVQDTAIRDNPAIQVVIEEELEQEEPGKQEKDRSTKDQNSLKANVS